MESLLAAYRCSRVVAKQLVGTEPVIRVKRSTKLEYHGNKGYGGWAIPIGCVRSGSVVVDVGLGEDISFSESLISKFDCTVHGFDPTPKAIKFVKKLEPKHFILYEQGVAGQTRIASFYLPNEQNYVSGSIAKAEHVGVEEIQVQLLSIGDMFKSIGHQKIALLKIDIEGAEYELLGSEDFRRFAPNIDVICIEFHHRWKEFGKRATLLAVQQMEEAGFECVWRSASSNEEFTFCQSGRDHSLRQD